MVVLFSPDSIYLDARTSRQYLGTITKILHHTCESRSATDLEKAPFTSNDRSHFLGMGYYFWDDNMEYAKYWGEVFYLRKSKGCKVMQFNASWSSDIFFDFLERANGRYVNTIGEQLNKKGPKRWKICEIIEYLKREDSFPFSVIRAVDLNATRFQQLALFTPAQNSGNTDLNPCYIVCVTRLEDIDLSQRSLVYESNPPK